MRQNDKAAHAPDDNENNRRAGATGDTHFIVYATGDSPYGPFTYRGRILEPVQG